jgi:hypothetical protein
MDQSSPIVLMRKLARMGPGISIVQETQADQARGLDPCLELNGYNTPGRTNKNRPQEDQFGSWSQIGITEPQTSGLRLQGEGIRPRAYPCAISNLGQGQVHGEP